MRVLRVKSKLTRAILAVFISLFSGVTNAQELTGWVKTQVTITQQTSKAAVNSFIYPNTKAARELNQVEPTSVDSTEQNTIGKETFDVLPGQIDFPDAYETVLEQDVRKAIKSWIADQAQATDVAETLGQRMTLSFDVNVAADYWRPAKWRSPVYLAHADTASDDALRANGFPGRFSDVTIGVDTGVNKVSGTPRLTLRMILIANGERVWTGYAGAPINGASRAQIARALSQILVERMGRTTDEPALVFTPSGESTIEINTHIVGQ